MLSEDRQWRWRGGARQQTAPYARSRDWKWSIANGGVAHRRCSEC